jgi:hypothetical protein
MFSFIIHDISVKLSLLHSISQACGMKHWKFLYYYLPLAYQRNWHEHLDVIIILYSTVGVYLLLIILYCRVVTVVVEFKTSWIPTSILVYQCLGRDVSKTEWENVRMTQSFNPQCLCLVRMCTSVIRIPREHGSPDLPDEMLYSENSNGTNVCACRVWFLLW